MFYTPPSVVGKKARPSPLGESSARFRQLSTPRPLRTQNDETDDPRRRGLRSGRLRGTPTNHTAIPPSPTGCYYRVPGVALYGVLPLVQPRYEPAPCNVINANQPAVVEQGVGGGSWASPAAAPSLPGDGQPVISSEDCIGAVVNGVCHGTPAPGAPTATCHGQMVGGVCTGPMF
jgi:hypothetical protein